MRTNFVLSLVLAVCCGSASANPAADPASAALRCTKLIEANARLACYDAAFGVPSHAPEEFGLDETALRARDPERPQTIELDRIEATVSTLGGANDATVTLDNGQVWVLTGRSAAGRLSAGDRVQIRRAALSSHKLITPDGIGLKVKRVR